MTPTNPTEVQMKLAREALEQAATELAPPSSSMRMNDFTDKAAQISARAIVLAIQATEARAQGLVETLENLLDDGHSFESEGQARDAARRALATWRRT